MKSSNFDFKSEPGWIFAFAVTPAIVGFILLMIRFLIQALR